MISGTYVLHGHDRQGVLEHLRRVVRRHGRGRERQDRRHRHLRGHARRSSDRRLAPRGDPRPRVRRPRDGRDLRRAEHEDHRGGREGSRHSGRAQLRLRDRHDPEYSVFNPLNLLEGRWPRSGDEVVVDAGKPRTRGLRRRSDDPDLDARAEAGLRGGRHRPLRRRQVAGNRPSRSSTSRRRRRCSSGTGSSTRFPWRARRAPRRSS